jgi:hypothetical protein
MADKDISTITAGTVPLDGTEKVHLIQGVNSRRLVTQDIANIGAPLDTQSGTTYTLIAADRGKWIRFTNAAAIALTVDNSVHAAGDEITIEQAGAGVITVTAGAGFTVNSSGTLIDSNGQYAVLSLKFISASVATLVGDRA